MKSFHFKQNFFLLKIFADFEYLTILQHKQYLAICSLQQRDFAEAVVNFKLAGLNWKMFSFDLSFLHVQVQNMISVAVETFELLGLLEIENKNKIKETNKDSVFVELDKTGNQGQLYGP